MSRKQICSAFTVYVDKDGEVERRVQKIYYGPLQYRKRATLLLPVAVVVLVVAVYLVYKPVGEAVIHWLANVVSTQVREGVVYGKI